MSDNGSLEILRYIFERQKVFNQKILEIRGCDIDNLSIEEKVWWTREYSLHLIGEINDLLKQTPDWKIHRRKTEPPFLTSNVMEELIDIFKYTLSMVLIWDMTPEDFLQRFDDKSEIVELRHLQEFKSNMSDRIVVCDIDGTISSYPECFIKYITDEHGYTIEGTPDTLDLRSWMADTVEPMKFIELKHQYRSSGYKRNLPVNEDIVELLRDLKMAGRTIILMTKRPYHQYKRIYSDTLYWLKANNIPCDGIVWDANKAERAIKDYGERVEFFIEDDLSEAEKIARAGYKCYLLLRKHNSFITMKNVSCVSNAKYIRRDIKCLQSLDLESQEDLLQDIARNVE